MEAVDKNMRTQNLDASKQLCSFFKRKFQLLSRTSHMSRRPTKQREAFPVWFECGVAPPPPIREAPLELNAFGDGLKGGNESVWHLEEPLVGDQA